MMLSNIINDLKEKIRIYKNVKIRIYNKGYFGTRGKSHPATLRFQKAMKAEKKPNILMFGDSVCLRVASQDKDKRTLGEMVVEKMKPERVYVTCFSAYTSFMHSAFLGLARKMDVKPDWVILSYNMRCTSPQWDACPIWQYTQENAVVRALTNEPNQRPGAISPTYNDKQIYHSSAFSSPLSDFRTIGEFKAATRNKPKDPELVRERLRNLLIMHYGQPIGHEHRQIGFLCSAIRQARATGAKVLVYLTPINHVFIEEIGGAEFVDVVRKNRDAVKSAVKEAGLLDQVVFEDWADAFTPDHFFHEEETTEHLAEHGRIRLSSMIASRITEDSNKKRAC